MTQTIGIYLYDEAEVLDFAGPFEVFSTASRVFNRSNPGMDERFRVVTIARRVELVQARGGFPIMPACDFSTHPPLDVLIIPGGIHTAEMGNLDVQEWAQRVAPGTVITASVCTGAFILGKAGLLDGIEITTHWEDIPDLRKLLPQAVVRENARWIDQGSIVTSAGISAGIDMSLHLVARLESEELASRTARQMEYDWQKRGAL